MATEKTMKQPISAKNFWAIYWTGIVFFLITTAAAGRRWDRARDKLQPATRKEAGS